MASPEYPNQEQRRYVRLDTVLPVQLRLESLDGTRFISAWLQGFTNNVSKAGVCLCINNLDPALAGIMQKQLARASLEIELPVLKKPIIAHARIVWFKNLPQSPNKYLIGLCYEQIDPKQNNRIMSYARIRRILFPSGFSVVVLLGLFVALGALLNIKLSRDNRILVQRLVNVLQESGEVKENIAEISREKDNLKLQIQTLELRMAAISAQKSVLEDEVKKAPGEYFQKMEDLNLLIQSLSREKELLKEKLASAEKDESAATEELLRLYQKRANLEKANVDKMYQWVKAHQNARTGLVISLEGDRDARGWAFIYDQALAAQAYTYYSDYGNAHKVFDFFLSRAKKKNELFFNAYYADDGEPAEYIIHSGPNIWVGIAIMQYTQRTMDKRYLPLAEEIARAIMSLQEQSKDGGIPGGPGIDWYATEHNLDAYAFFNMLHTITSRKQYLDSANKILKWLVENTYNKPELPIRRGKGDSTVATDTYAWSIAAVGPDRLERLGMSPDRIIEFAEANCAVEVDYLRPEGRTVRIKGFDFAPERHVARGGIVSSEWTAQMVIAFKIMEGFYSQKGMTAKAKGYMLKAEEYLSSLGSMIISSPSPSGQGESCLPYATQDSVDTGHGWLTPKGKSTGSLSGTAYAIFAYYNYNPLGFQD